MLDSKISQADKLAVHGLLVGVELQEGTDIEGVMRAIGSALQTFKGIGTVDIEHLGEIEIIDQDLGNQIDPKGFMDSLTSDMKES